MGEFLPYSSVYTPFYHITGSISSKSKKFFSFDRSDGFKGGREKISRPPLTYYIILILLVLESVAYFPDFVGVFFYGSVRREVRGICNVFELFFRKRVFIFVVPVDF